GGRFMCRSTALGANGAGTHSHPGRVLLRYEVVAGVVVGAPPPVRTGQAHSHPRRVLLRYGVVAGVFVGAPPPVRTGQAHIRTRGGCSYDTGWWQACCRSTAGSPDRPVRTGQAHIRTRGG